MSVPTASSSIASVSTNSAAPVSATVIPFPTRAPAASFLAHSEKSRIDQKRLMEAVYAGGGLDIAADDVRLKAVAARLQILGFVTVEEVGQGGRARRMRPSETIEAEPGLPWRLSRCAGSDFSGLALPVC